MQFHRVGRLNMHVVVFGLINFYFYLFIFLEDPSCFSQFWHSWRTPTKIPFLFFIYLCCLLYIRLLVKAGIRAQESLNKWRKSDFETRTNFWNHDRSEREMEDHACLFRPCGPWNSKRRSITTEINQFIIIRKLSNFFFFYNCSNFLRLS